MRLDDKLYLISTSSGYDEDMNPIETTAETFIGKCKILPNERAAKTRGNDGLEYIYSFVIFVKNPLAIIHEGEKVRFVKNDGTIDKTMTVSGFVTLRKWEKLWV